MGYHTDFTGQFELDKPLTPEHLTYLKAFSETRRMHRDAEKTALRSDPIREAVGLPVGEHGAYFVSAGGDSGQEGMMGSPEANDILDVNRAPGELATNLDNFAESYSAKIKHAKEGNCQPGLWCQWIPTEDGTAIEWDEGEKFYAYIEWIKYLLKHFLEPWGYVLNGDVRWNGEETDDMGIIRIENNRVGVGRAVTEVIFD